jgi:hypothetical protein
MANSAFLIKELINNTKSKFLSHESTFLYSYLKYITKLLPILIPKRIVNQKIPDYNNQGFQLHFLMTILKVDMILLVSMHCKHLQYLHLHKFLKMVL